LTLIRKTSVSGYLCRNKKHPQSECIGDGIRKKPLKSSIYSVEEYDQDEFTFKEISGGDVRDEG
jgi:hypothetical protein